MLRFGRDRRVPQEEGDPAPVHAKYKVSKKPHSVILSLDAAELRTFKRKLHYLGEGKKIPKDHGTMKFNSDS